MSVKYEKNNLKPNVMKKVFLLLVLISPYLKAEEFSGYYITNNLDTVNCIININYHNFSKVTKKVNLIDNEGKKKFKPNEINSFVINTRYGEPYKFVSLGVDEKNFYHEIINGKISLYIFYPPTLLYGGPEIPVALKDNELVFLNAINRKQRVSNLLKDNPVVLEKWEATKFNAWTDSNLDTTEIEKYFREYNEFYTNEE